MSDQNTTTLVLEWLRDLEHRTKALEGCSEPHPPPASTAQDLGDNVVDFPGRGGAA